MTFDANDSSLNLTLRNQFAIRVIRYKLYANLSEAMSGEGESGLLACVKPGQDGGQNEGTIEEFKLVQTMNRGGGEATSSEQSASRQNANINQGKSQLKVKVTANDRSTGKNI